MTTIEQTRPQNKQAQADLTRVGGIAAANTNTEKPDPFSRALDLWRTRRSDIDNAPLSTSSEHEDRLYDLLTAAENRLLDQPIKSIADLRALAEVIWQDPHSLPGVDTLSALFEGLKALDKGNTSRTFDAEHWLKYYEMNGGGWIETEGEITLIHHANVKDGLRDLLWVLDTRDAHEAVKEAIRIRIMREKEPQPTWGKILSEYQSADARLGEHATVYDESECGSPENLAHEAKTERLADEHAEALNALFRHPSPDYEGFAMKADIYANRDVYAHNEAAEFAQIIAKEAAQFAR